MLGLLKDPLLSDAILLIVTSVDGGYVFKEITPSSKIHLQIIT